MGTEFAERIHQSRCASASVMRIGEHEGPFATESEQLVSNPRERSESENHTRRQRGIFKRLHAACLRAHDAVLFTLANSSIIASRMANFCTLPVTVDGKFSTNRM